MPLAITYSIDHRTEICETTIHGAARIDRWIRNASVRIEQPTLVEYVVLHCAAANNNREFGRRHSIFHAKANWIGFEDGLWATGRHVSLSVRPAYMARATCFAKVRRHRRSAMRFASFARRSRPDNTKQECKTYSNTIRSRLYRARAALYKLFRPWNVTFFPFVHARI